MSLLIGTPLPEPLFTRVKQFNKWGVLRKRDCVEQACHFRWATVEVALTPNWPECPADVCPELKKGHTKVLHMMHATAYVDDSYARAHLSRYPSHGEANIYRLGGVWRRRECDHCAKCGHMEKYHGEHKAFGKVVYQCAPREASSPYHHWCGCEEFVPCTRNGKIRRWTTGEFSIHGVVTKDIAMCPECGSRSTASWGRSKASQVGHRRI